MACGCPTRHISTILSRKSLPRLCFSHPQVFPAAYLDHRRTVGTHTYNGAWGQASAAGGSAAADAPSGMDWSGEGRVEEGLAGEEDGSGEDASGYRVVLYTESAFMDGVLLICGEWLLSSSPDQVRRWGNAWRMQGDAGGREGGRATEG